MSRPAATPAPPRVRRGRLALACGSLLTTTLVAAAAVGLLPTPGSSSAVEVAQAQDAGPVAAQLAAVAGPTAGDGGLAGPGDAAALGVLAQPEVQDRPGGSADPPSGSGRGRRVVFDQATQHVWLVGEQGTVTRDYPVSGSVTDNLDPGTYEVYSRSRHATSFDLSSTMGYMVRFSQGESAAIGFHSIPVDAHKDPLQDVATLGTPQSHGCIRQRRSDAVAMWRFAGIGTTVVVV